MELKKTTIRYWFEDDGKRYAEIFLIKFGRECWQFDKVEFETQNSPYSLEDWQFLREVANKIDEFIRRIK